VTGVRCKLPNMRFEVRPSARTAFLRSPAETWRLRFLARNTLSAPPWSGRPSRSSPSFTRTFYAPHLNSHQDERGSYSFTHGQDEKLIRSGAAFYLRAPGLWTPVGNGITPYIKR
jgi:hypothetical protein